MSASPWKALQRIWLCFVVVRGERRCSLRVLVLYPITLISNVRNRCYLLPAQNMIMIMSPWFAPCCVPLERWINVVCAAEYAIAWNQLTIPSAMGDKYRFCRAWIVMSSITQFIFNYCAAVFDLPLKIFSVEQCEGILHWSWSSRCRMGFRRVGALAKYISSDLPPHQVCNEKLLSRTPS